MTALEMVRRDERLAPDAEWVSPPRVANLLDDLDGLAERLAASLGASDWLDSYLLAAGMNQVTEDYLHRDVLMLSRVAANVRGLPSPVGPVAGDASEVSRRLGLTVRAASRGERAVRAWQRRLAGLTQLLADQVVGPPGVTRTETEAIAATVLEQLPALPRRLRQTILRMPTCFQSLDQHHADCSLLAARFATRWPDRERVIRILGLRTSGSYLAPLVAAYLRRAGYRDVIAWTVRPGDDLFREERRRLEDLIASEALLLVVDDPPKSGSSLVKAVRWLEKAGLPRGRLVMLVPLTGSASTLPEKLASFPTVLLPWSDWSVHARLESNAVRDSLAGLLEGRVITATAADGQEETVGVRKVTAARRIQEPPITDLKSGSPVRRHVRSVYEVSVEDDRGRTFQHYVYAKGVGLGYFGRHSLTVADALTNLVPETYGLRDGLLFRAWVPEGARLDELTPAGVEPIARYVLARQANLCVPTDVSERMVGLNPVWQRVADMLAAPFGRGRSMVRPFTHAAALRLLKVAEPSVIDGSMALSQWFRASSGSRDLLKVDYDERAYSNQDTVIDQLYSFDAVYDLAAAAVDVQLGGGSDADIALRRAFEANAGPVGEERWFLYQLIVLKSYRQFLEAMRSEVAEGALTDLPAAVRAMLEPRALAAELALVGDSMSRIDQQYWRTIVLGGLEPTATGPAVAIDIDGVLETSPLGYSSVSEQGAIAIRALVAHGYRPLLVTGRSAADVRDRCRAFGLAGGVAEYGAALYRTRDDLVRDLRSSAARGDLERLRSDLTGSETIFVHPGYTHAVRASLSTSEGLRPLPEGLVRERLGALGLAGRVRAVQGWRQTDFMAAAIDKGGGTVALLDDLGASGHGLAFAIGDSVEDVPVMKMATQAMGPRNAEQSLTASGARLMRGGYQSGLVDAVAAVIGHRPGACDACRLPAQSPDTKLLLAALGAQRPGRIHKLHQALLLAYRVTRSR